MYPLILNETLFLNSLNSGNNLTNNPNNHTILFTYNQEFISLRYEHRHTGSARFYTVGLATFNTVAI